MSVYRTLSGICAVGLLAACGGGGGGGTPAPVAEEPDSSSSGAPPPLPAPSPPSGTPFVDATDASNIQYVVDFTRSGVSANIPRYTSGGVAAGDCDSDGDVDLFITYGDTGPNRLYLNQLDQGNPLTFRDTAATAGVANTRLDGAGNDRHSGPTFADMDGDGYLDLILGGLYSDPIKLYRNLGDCTFEDVSEGSGIGVLQVDGSRVLDADHTISSAFGDYDLDGDLDLFLTHWGSRLEGESESEHLYRNVSDGDGIRFENVSALSGIQGHILTMMGYEPSDGSVDDYTFTPTFARIDEDAWPDITLAADFGHAQLFLADPAARGTFVDATNFEINFLEYGMGSALGDFDFDGDLDWFVTSIFQELAGTDRIGLRGNRLFRNDAGEFVDVSDSAGIFDGGWGWAACFADLDNDGNLEIYHTNESSDTGRVFQSDGAGAFENVAQPFGLDDRHDGRGVVCADFDNDGDVDIFLLHNDRANSATLFENRSAAAGNNFLRVRLVGLPPNTEAAGARIFATIGAQTQMHEIMIGSNYTSQNPTVQVFGLGSAAAVDALRVEWPALVPGPGEAPLRPADTELADISAGQTLIVCHPELAPLPEACSTE